MDYQTKPLIPGTLPPGKEETILVIEDEPGVREIIRRLLEIRGYRTITAENGTDGLVLYRHCSDKVSLVLTDMRMPGVQGRELIKGLREINADARIVAMSGVLGENDQVREEPGRLTFLPKPMTMEELISAIQRVLVGPGAHAA